MINPCVWMRHGSSERSSQSPKSRAFRVTGLGFPSRLIPAAPPCALQTCRQTLVEGKRNDRAGTRSWLQAGPASSLLEGWRGSLSVKTSLTLLLRTPPGLPRSPRLRPSPHSVEQAAVSGPWDVRFTPVAPAVTQLSWSALIRVPAAVRSRPTSVLL